MGIDEYRVGRDETETKDLHVGVAYSGLVFQLILGYIMGVSS